MIADRVIDDARPRPGRTRREDGDPANRTLGIAQPRRRDARQRGELPDQEALHGARRRPGREPGPHMTQLHGPRSGDLVRTRRRHRLPAGPPELGLHRDHGLEHGREPPGRLPVGDGGAASAARRSSTSTRASRARARWRRTASGIRAGSDIAFLGGIVNYILEHERWFDEYVMHYTNAPVIIDEDFRDTEDLDGLFSGWDPETGKYDTDDVAVRGHGGARRRRRARAGPTQRRAVRPRRRTAAGSQHGEPPEEDPTLQHPRCVFQILKRHYARYTPEFVAETCGCTRRGVPRGREALCENSGRERTGAFVYAVGWTQHTVGVQYIRTAAIIQLLLGNMGRPGRRHHGAARPRVDPGLDRHPDALQHPARLPADAARRALRRPRGATSSEHVADRLVGQLRRVHRQPAEGVVGRRTRRRRTTSASTTCRGSTTTTRPTGRSSRCSTGRSRATSSPARTRRSARRTARRTGSRSRSSTGSSSATSSRSRRRRSGTTAPRSSRASCATEEIATEVFFLPAAAHIEKDGSFTNTQRLLQWHFKAVEPKERLPLRPLVLLPPRPHDPARSCRTRRSRTRPPLLDLTWDYPTHGEIEEPSAEAVLAEINGWDDETGEPLAATRS